MTDKRDLEAFGGCLLMALGFPVWWFITAFVKAYVARWMWIWFITPTFGKDAPGFATMYGLALFVGVLWPDPPRPKETSDTPWWATLLVGYPVLLLAGYITHWLMIR